MNDRTRSVHLLSLLVLLCVEQLRAADPKPGVNLDEAKVPAYTLPDPLRCQDGSIVTDAEGWRTNRRPELVKLFTTTMYGRSPDRAAKFSFTVIGVDTKALDGLATRKEITIAFDDDPTSPRVHLLLYVPNAAHKPVPAFVGVNFDGNHTIHRDSGITITEQWQWDGKTKRDALVKPADSSRGQGTGRWALETILARGYALATIPRADVEPDYPEGWKHGVRGLFLKRLGKTAFADDDWGAIAAWAWGLSRALDYLATDHDIDAKRVAVFGHSRMGKAALWAGARDQRFALVISNNSGEGGAALARRWFGETTAVLNKNFPHWFCGNFKQYSGKEATLPTDQHELLALIAPRPLYVASAVEDTWADPRGEFLAAVHAEPVCRLFGKTGLGTTTFPEVNHPVGDVIGYHLRTGKHDVTDYDWEQYLRFADRHIGGVRP